MKRGDSHTTGLRFNLGYDAYLAIVIESAYEGAILRGRSFGLWPLFGRNTLMFKSYSPLVFLLFYFIFEKL